MSEKDDEGEANPLGDGNVYYIPEHLIESNMALNTNKPDNVRESNVKIPRELIYLPGEPDRKNPQTNLFMKAFRSLLDKEISKQKKLKQQSGADIFANNNHYDIPETLVFSNLRMEDSPNDRSKAHHHHETYKIPKSLIKTNQDDSILSAPMPVRRDLEDDYELPSRKKGSSMTRVALQFQKNQRADIKRIKSIQSIDFESEKQGYDEQPIQMQDDQPGRKSRFKMPWQVFKKSSRRQNYMSQDPFVEGKREVKERMQELRRVKSFTSIDSTEQAKTNVSKPKGIDKDKLALFLANAQKIKDKKDAANQSKEQQEQIRALFKRGLKANLQKAQLTYEERIKEEKAQKELRMQKLLDQSEKLKAKQQYDAFISKNIDPYVEKAKKDVKLKMELQRAKSIDREDSLDRASDVPGEDAPIYEKSTSLFFQNKMERYKTKDKKSDDFGNMSPITQSRTSGNFFNSQEIHQTKRKRHQRENPSIILEASREATLPTQGQEDIILEHKQRMISLEKAEKKIMIDLVQMDKVGEKIKLEQALKKSGKSHQSESGNMGMISQYNQNEIDNPSADLSNQGPSKVVIIKESATNDSPIRHIRGQNENTNLFQEQDSFNITKISEESKLKSPEDLRFQSYNQSMQKFKKEKLRLSKNMMAGSLLQQRLQKYSKNSNNQSSKQSSGVKSPLTPNTGQKSSSKHSSKDAKSLNLKDDTELKHLKKRKVPKEFQSINIDKIDYINKDILRANEDEEEFEEMSRNSRKITLSNIESQHSQEDQQNGSQNQALNFDIVRPKGPSRPQAFIKWSLQQKGTTGGDILGQGGGDAYNDDLDETSKLYEAMSYGKLMKNIAIYHPIEDETNQKFSFNERVTVKDFETKLTDVCGCIWIKAKIKQLSKILSKMCFPRRRTGKKKFQPPESIGMIAMDSDSDDDESSEDIDKGLTKCSQSIGDGAALYIQMMYTFMIMFFLLTLLNMPIYMIYEASTSGNNLQNIDELFKYFTLGNLGQFSKKCDYSDFSYRFDENLNPPDNIINIDCEKGVIAKLLNFGFMYSYDQEYGGMSEADKQCDHVENPMKPYKWKPPEPLVCDDEVMGIVEFEICQIKVKEEQGEITEEQSVYQQCLITNNGNVDQCAPIIQNNFNDFVYVNSEQQPFVYAYVTNPSCDGLTYFWNYDRGNSFEMTAEMRINPFSNQEYIVKWTLVEPPENDGFSEMFTEAEPIYRDYDGKILGLKVYEDTMFNVQEDSQGILVKDLCDEKEADTEEEVEIDPLDLVNVLDTNIWDPSGQIPDIPNTDQFQTFGNIDPECGFQNTSAVIRKSPLFQDRESQQLFLSYFDENCFEKQKCVLDPAKMGYQMGDNKGSKPVTRQKTGLFGLISNDCKYRMSNEAYQNITSQQYIGVFGCKFDDVMIPGQTETRVHKEIIGVVVIVADFLCMVIVIYFFTKLESLNNEFLKNVDDLRVQMKDFGVIIENVILDKYTYDSRIIKMKVWLHFKQLLAPKMDKFNDFSCIDVTLSLYSQPSIQLVFRMQEIQLEINEIKTKLLLNEYKDSQIPNKQDRLRFLDEKRERFEKRYANLVQKIEHNSHTENILTVQRVPKAQRIKEIQYIFVIFRGCETNGVVLNEYQRQSGPEAFINYLNKSLRPNTVVDNTLFGKSILVKPIVEPDEIIWQNLAYNAKEQKVRSSITQFISLFFIVINMVFTIFLTGVTIQMNRSIPDPIGCPDQPIPKKDAYEDYQKDHDEFMETKSIGLMACYCKVETNIFLPWTIIKHNFAEFSPDGQDKKNICLEWQGLQIAKSITLSIVSSAAVIINEFLAVFFQIMGKFQKKHTKMEEQINCFRQILVQEYINMGIITLITSFDKIGVTEMILGENADQFNVYDNFSPDWYMDYGKKICLYIFMSSFLINAKDITEYVKKELIRLWDRKGKSNLKFDPEDEDCDLPNSRERVQVRLEQLYMGDIFKGEKNYSRMISTLFVILTYCSGMPIMYFNGLVFYLVTYCVNKYLILSFYQKSRTLTRSIPLFIAGILKYGIIIHLIMSMLMLTNKEGFKTQTTHQGVPPLIDIDKQQEKMIEEGTLTKETAAENNKIMRNRFYFMHQQLYFAFLIIIVFSYLIGKNTKIIIRLILNAFLKAFKACFNSIKNYCSVRSEIVQIKLKHSIQLQKEKLEEELQKRVEIEIKTKEQKYQEKLEKRKKQAIIREKEQMEYEMKKVQEFEACKGPIEINALLEKHLQEDEQRQITEQERIDKEREEDEEDNIQSIDIAEVKNDEEIERITKEKEAQELKEQEQEEAKRAAIEQLTKRFERPDYSDDIYIELSTESLSYLYQRANRELADFWEIFQYNNQIPENLLEPDNHSPYKDLFLETCYTYRISVDDAFTYQKFLNDRIKDIEAVIDRYMNLLKTTLLEKMKNGFEKDRRKRKLENKEGSLKDQVAQTKYEEWFIKYSDQVQFDNPKYYPYSKKLKILVQFQEELIAADCNRKDNKLGVQDICRMTGSLTQSYFIFDAQEYKVARRIYYNLDKQEELNESQAQEEEEEEEEPEKDQDVRSLQSLRTKKSTRTKNNLSTNGKPQKKKSGNITGKTGIDQTLISQDLQELSTPPSNGNTGNGNSKKLKRTKTMKSTRL